MVKFLRFLHFCFVSVFFVFLSFVWLISIPFILSWWSLLFADGNFFVFGEKCGFMHMFSWNCLCKNEYIWILRLADQIDIMVLSDI